MSQELLAQLFSAALFILGGCLLGFIIEKIILARLARLAEKTAWAGDDIIISALQGLVIPLVALGGVYGALLVFPLGQSLEKSLAPLLTALAVVIVTIIVSKIAVGFVTLYSTTLSHVLPSSSIFVNIARVSVIAVGLLIALQTMGISITPLITALGVGGLAVALAFQDTLSNLFSGLQILISQQLKPGDYVCLENGLEGVVEDITWRNTSVKSSANNQIIVPNSKLATSVITNYSKPSAGLTFPIAIGLSYAADLQQVERVILEVATTIIKTVPGGDPDFIPLVRFHTFGNSAVEANIILRAQGFVEQHLLKHECIKALHSRFKQENIDIPYPIQTVILKQDA